MWILTMNWVDEVITIKKHISMNFAVFSKASLFWMGDHELWHLQIPQKSPSSKMSVCITPYIGGRRAIYQCK